MLNRDNLPTAAVVELREHQQQRERLRAAFPTLDDQTLTDTLEGLTNLREILAELIRSALVDEALAFGLSTRLSEMKSRHDRLELRAQRKRDLARLAMSEASIEKIIEGDFTASLRQAPPGLEVACEDKIPAAYWKPQPAKLDRQGLLAALKNGVEIEGAHLKTSQAQLSVRTK